MGVERRRWDEGLLSAAVMERRDPMLTFYSYSG
jgi:hypothetical protein